MIASGPNVSHGIILTSFKGMLVGSFCLYGRQAARCYF